MRKQIIENAAYDVATQVRVVEETIDAALAELAELQGRMVRARSATGIAFTRSHGAFEELAVSMSGLVAARGGIANCHVALAESKQFIPGLRTVGWGDGDDCPKTEDPKATLRVVA